MLGLRQANAVLPPLYCPDLDSLLELCLGRLGRFDRLPLLPSKHLPQPLPLLPEGRGSLHYRQALLRELTAA